MTWERGREEILGMIERCGANANKLIVGLRSEFLKARAGFRRDTPTAVLYDRS